MRAFMILMAASALVLSQTAAAGPPIDREACAGAYETAQRAMRDSRLLEARRQLRACLDDACPAFLRSDCATWLNEVERRTPSVVVVVRRPGGELVSQGSVMVDGVPWAARIDGKAQEIDPGEHTFYVTLPGAAPIERRALVHEGERLQRVVIEIAPALQAWARTPAPLVRSSRPVPTSAIVFAGLAGIGAAGFGTFAIMGRVGQSDLDACKPDCTEQAVGAVRAKYNVADVFLFGSVASLVTAAVLYVTRPVELVPLAPEPHR